MTPNNDDSVKLNIAMVFDKWAFLRTPDKYNEKSLTKRRRIALAKADRVMAIVRGFGDV